MDQDIIAVRIEGELRAHDSFEDIGYDVGLFHPECAGTGSEHFVRIFAEDHAVRRFELEPDSLCDVCDRTID